MKRSQDFPACALYLQSLEQLEACIGSEAVLTGKHTHLKYFILIRNYQLGTEATDMFGIHFIESN